MLILCVLAIIFSVFVSFILWSAVYLFIGVGIMSLILFLFNTFGFWIGWFIMMELIIGIPMAIIIFLCDDDYDYDENGQYRKVKDIKRDKDINQR